MMKDKKGQMTVTGIIMVVVTLVVYAAIYPLLSDAIGTFTNTSGDPWLNMIISLVPLFILLAIIITIFMYVSPQRPEY